MSILGMIVVGLIAGALARLLVPGRDALGWVGTIVLGLVGALVGGLIAGALGDDDGVGIIGATLGAILVLFLWNAVTRRSSRTRARL